MPAIVIASVAIILAGMAIGRHESRTQSVETRELGQLLMARVGQTFVSDSRQSSSKTSGVTFYTQPTAYGSWVCKVISVSVSPRIAGVIAMSRSDATMDDVSFGTRYGIWRHLNAPEPSRETANAACLAYRDFDHLVSEEHPFAADRGANLADVILSQARYGNIRFKISCIAVRSPTEIPPCNGVDVLRRLSLKQLWNVSTQSDKQTGQSTVREDRLTFVLKPEAQGKMRLVEVTVTSEQPHGKADISAADVSSVKIMLSCMC